MENESGAYIFFNDSDEIHLFLFKKCEREVLKNALPINFSCGKLEDIPNIIKEKNMYNILDNSYENCISNGFYKLTKKQFNNFKDFSKTQLENN
jgi:hypothetical protein